MTVEEILRAKGTDVFTVVPGVTLSQVTELLVEHNCGSLVVVDSEGSRRMIGIVTERDILRACAKGQSLHEVKVGDAMTTKLITGRASDTVTKTMGLMTENRIRHLPVVEDDTLAGIISIGDVVKAQHDYLSAENHHLKSYIQG